MKKNLMFALPFFTVSAAYSAPATIDDASLATFTAGEAAKAEEVNQNFSVLKSGINDLVLSFQSINERVQALEDGATLNNSVAGRCYRVTSYEVEIARKDDANSTSPWLSQNGYIDRMQVKNGYAIFSSANNTARINVRRDTVNQYFVETGGGNYSTPDAGESGDYTHTEYSNNDVTWTQSGSTVTTERSRGAGEGVESINFTASLGGDILFATDIETSRQDNASKFGAVELYLLSEMSCAEAEQGEAGFPASN